MIKFVLGMLAAVVLATGLAAMDARVKLHRATMERCTAIEQASGWTRDEALGRCARMVDRGMAS